LPTSQEIFKAEVNLRETATSFVGVKGKLQ